MLLRRIILSAAALLLTGLAGSEALADRRRPPPPPPPPYYEDEYYPGPPLIRRIPGLRILFGDYAMSQEEYDALYGPRRHRQFDERYYEPEIPPPPPRSTAKPKATAAKPQKPATATAAKPSGQKSTAANQKLASSAGPLSCEKATSVVSGYGFSSVEAASCSGKVYAFNAKRGGNAFAIKLDSASGELTEVKKLP